ncbi:hypothetical protein QBC37DRAFT_373811 [Rhypophila decipiens]|uniref:Uncharacterized protein n=1 Tax=Rhypophila decipiens TaxID=261697 RepID=A0AAN7BA83_9PEZI|nr:hypothetical protein QBC37DRAFT_373811 [Rhypophila decipiens]
MSFFGGPPSPTLPVKPEPEIAETIGGTRKRKTGRGQNDVAKRARESLVKLPFEEDGTPKLIDRSRVTYKYRGEGHDVLLCNDEPNKINWRAPNFRKGDPYSQMALVEPTAAGHDAIANTFDRVVSGSDAVAVGIFMVVYTDQAIAKAKTVLGDVLKKRPGSEAAARPNVVPPASEEPPDTTDVDTDPVGPNPKPTKTGAKSSRYKKKKEMGRAPLNRESDELEELEQKAWTTTIRCVRLNPEYNLTINDENLAFFVRYLIENRGNKCPLYSEYICWLSLLSLVYDKDGFEFKGVPWTQEFSRLYNTNVKTREKALQGGLLHWSAWEKTKHSHDDLPPDNILFSRAGKPQDIARCMEEGLLNNQLSLGEKEMTEARESQARLFAAQMEQRRLHIQQSQEDDDAPPKIKEEPLDDNAAWTAPPSYLPSSGALPVVSAKRSLIPAPTLTYKNRPAMGERAEEVFQTIDPASLAEHKSHGRNTIQLLVAEAARRDQLEKELTLKRKEAKKAGKLAARKKKADEAGDQEMEGI